MARDAAAWRTQRRAAAGGAASGAPVGGPDASGEGQGPVEALQEDAPGHVRQGQQHGEDGGDCGGRGGSDVCPTVATRALRRAGTAWARRITSVPEKGHRQRQRER